MPAIQPARLKQQAAALAQHYADPPAYIRSLSHLLDIYADRIHRPGQSGEPQSLIQAYRVPAPVMRRVLFELAGKVAEDPAPALPLCDALWEVPILEYRQLAAGLLGKIPPQFAGEVVERIFNSLETEKDIRLQNLLVNPGLARLSKEEPRIVLDLIARMLSSDSEAEIRAGLHASTLLLQERDFTNLPVVYRLLRPYVLHSPSNLRPDILDVVNSLARKSPNETAHYFQELMQESYGTSWYVRQALHMFPAELQSNLRESMRSLGR